MLNNDFPVHTHTKHPTTDIPPPLRTDKQTLPQKNRPHLHTLAKRLRFITKLFLKAYLRIELRTYNTIQRQLMQKQPTPDKYTRTGTYNLTWRDWNKAYVGQTVGSYIERFNEHKNAFQTNSHLSSYAKHILEQSHSFGPIHNTMQIPQYHSKGTHLDTIGRY